MPYIFDSKDILNSTIRLGSDVVFSTSTTISIIHRNVTTLYSTGMQPLGAIHWKSGALEVLGVRKSTDVIKTKLHFFLNTNWERAWQWDPTGPRYKVGYEDSQWTATNTSTQKVHATMNVYKSHFFAEPTLASIKFTRSVREFDQIFLLLIFLRMETKRKESEKRRRRGANPGMMAASGPGGFVGGI